MTCVSNVGNHHNLLNSFILNKDMATRNCEKSNS